MNQQYGNSIIEHILDPDTYQPIIVGQLDELITRIKTLQTLFPKSVEVFQGILLAHQKRHPLLEDWLIIPIYLFIWNGESDKLKWIEERFNEFAVAIDTLTWSNWVKEIICQTNCLTTHRIYDRIYDYFLHMYGALYLIRQGWNIRLLTMDAGGPDIEASRGEELCVMECKFKHTSKKIDSFFWRFDFACNKFCESKPIITNDQFRFPDAQMLRELPPKHCIAIKQFISKIYLHSNAINRGTFGDLKFEYHPCLAAATTIDSQQNAANSSAITFLQGTLSQTLERAAEQLSVTKYQNRQRILFLGLQLDAFYLAPWTEAEIEEIKLLLPLKAYYKYGIKVVFSDDVGFSVARYL